MDKQAKKNLVFFILIIASLAVVSGCGRKEETHPLPLSRGELATEKSAVEKSSEVGETSPLPPSKGELETATSSSEFVETATSTEETKTGYEVIEPEKIDCTDEMDVSCWKTFVNYDYGYKVKFLKDWDFNEWEFTDWESTEVGKKKRITAFYNKKNADNGISIRTEENNNSVTYSNFNEWKKIYKSEIKPREERQIGGYNGIVLIKEDGLETIGYYFYIIKDDKIIIFCKENIDGGIENNKIFEKMIESLKLF